MFSRSSRFLCLYFALCTSALSLFLPISRAQNAPPSATQQKSRSKPSSSATKNKSKNAQPEVRENFALLPVQDSLKLEMAVLGEVDDKPGLPFIRERWHLLWRHGDPIDLYIVKPRGVEKAPVVLYLYSYPQDTDRFKTDSWSGYVTGNGFAAVGFVSALTGHRLEHRAPKETFFTELQESIGASVHDVQMILDFLSTRKDLDMNRIGMFGQGSGGAIALLASAVDARIKSVDVLTPWGDWPNFIAKSPFIPSEDRLLINTPEFISKMAPLEPITYLSKLKARGLRIQDVRKEGHMPDASQEKLEAAAPDTVEINQFGDGAALVPASANGKLLDWIKSQLQPDAKPQLAMDRAQRIHFFPPKMPIGSPVGEIH